MTRFAFMIAFAFLLSPPLKATYMEEKPISAMTYTQKGKVFDTHTYELVKQVFDGEGARINHKPSSVLLCLASVEFLDPNVVLHNNYYTKFSANEAIKSFTLTPNPHSLCEQAPALGNLCHDIYAKIPVRLNAKATDIELLIFNSSWVLERPDYANTIAHGLRIILCSYIQSAYDNMTLPSLQTVTISDRDPALLETLLSQGPIRDALSGQYEQESFEEATTTPYWKISYKLKGITQNRG